MTLETKKQLLRAKKLIQAGKYKQAQKLLWDIDHPQAEIWLTKLESRLESTEKKKTSKDNTWVWIGVAITFAVVVLLATGLIVSTLMSSQIRTEPEATVEQYTIVVTPTPAVSQTMKRFYCEQWAREDGYEGELYDYHVETCIRHWD